MLDLVAGLLDDACLMLCWFVPRCLAVLRLACIVGRSMHLDQLNYYAGMLHEEMCMFNVQCATIRMLFLRVYLHASVCTYMLTYVLCTHRHGTY